MRRLAVREMFSCIAMGVLLAACAKDPAPAAVPKTVLVVQPGAGLGVAGEAFAGDVRAREESPLAFRVGGNLQKRLVDAGQMVQKGQLLAALDPGDAQLQRAAAKADVDRLNGDLQRYRKLLAQQLISQSAFDAQQAGYLAARAKYDLMRNQDDYTQLRAPADGVIASRQAEAGQVVAAGQPIYVLAAQRGREVAISLPEARIRDFQTGQKAKIELWNAPGQLLSGHLREIAAVADPQTRTYAARVAVETEDAGKVELGQSARVWIGAAPSGGALRLPLSAVQRARDGASSVWVVDASGQVQPRAVKLAGYGADSVPVLDGVSAQDWVVAAGGHLLRAGETVRPVDRKNRPVTPQGH